MARTTDSHKSLEIGRALRHLTSGGVVVLPTDTLYGLAADVFNPAGVQRVFDIKGRAPDMALPLLVSDWAMAAMVAKTDSNVAQCLARKYWPGPLTLVLPRLEGLSDLVTGGRDTVAVRSPRHWVPQGLIARLGRPLTGTSANLSGGPDPQSLEQVRGIMGGLVDYIISRGPVPAGTASTIVGVAGGPPYMIREGAIPFPEILNSC